MRKDIKFSANNARFYITQIIDALDTLHKNKIIYRDLKPENLHQHIWPLKLLNKKIIVLKLIGGL